jgi:rubrerythrin
LDKNSFNDIIEMAKKREENSYALYLNCAKRAKNALSKDFFFKLAEEEDGHIKHLESITLWDVRHYNKRKIAELKTSEFLIDVRIDENMPLQDVILYAIKSEQHAVDFYGGLLNMTDDKNIKKVLRLLKDEEIKHKNKLEEAYEDSSYQFF